MYEPKYSQQEIDEVAQTDMVSFLSSTYGFHFRRKGNGYSCVEHSSLFINANRRWWYWNSKGVGGDNIFVWNKNIEHIGFKNTMMQILGKVFEESIIDDTPEKSTNNQKDNHSHFDANGIPQQTEGKFANLFAYLIQTRCISKDVISELVKEKKIYQDTRKNIVFTNRDENGNIKFWCQRGTNPELKYTKNAPGSNNEYYGFTLNCNPDSDTVYVFEAPIDLLSHCTIADIRAKKSGAWREQNRIALLGVNDYALECYLPTHPNIKTIKFCLDNDEAGIKATEKYSRKYSELGYHIEKIFYNGPGKDMNEVLCNHIQRIQMKKEAAPKQTVLSQETESEAEHEEEHTTKKMNSDRYIMGK